VLTDVWQDFLSIVRQEAGSRVVETWLKAVKIAHWSPEEKAISIEAPNTFVKEWIASKYLQLFQTHLARLLHVDALKVTFTSSTENKSEEHKKNSVFALPLSKKGIPGKIKNALTYKTRKNYGHLNPSYTFETFVVGPSNSLAYAAACSIVDNPGDQYNPFFLYGGSGLGKTHLLHAMGNAIQKRDSKAVVFYQTTDRFVNEFISAIRFNKIHLFQQRYRMIDVLLLDDIQFLSNKEQTQEAFFHIFNSLYDARKQIVFSSDLFPRDIKGLAERLCTRLEWGLVADIHKPHLETKIAILKRKAQVHNEDLPDDVAEFIAQHALSNVRELEGSLVRVLAFSSLTKQSLSVELTRKVLYREPAAKKKEAIGFDRISSCVCRHYSYRLSDLRSNSRAKDLSFARQLTMYLMKKMTQKSLREIGGFLGRKDHSTVIHAFDRVQENAEKDSALRSTIRRLEEEILR
jgi:chromosomal replication initiator protein